MSHYNKNKPETIQAMFGSIASNYDRTNAVLSFQLNKLWNRQLVHAVHSDVFADLCCGTGEIAFTRLKKRAEPSEGYLIDFCEEMLTEARHRAGRMNLQQHKLHYIQADVQSIPLPDQSVGSATMAYGIRNVKDPSKCLKDVYRILKPDGKFGILELTQPTNPILRMGHQIYLRTVLPVLGKLLTSNQEAYTYLCKSIHTFIKPKELACLMTEAGFHSVEIKPLHGGIATLIIGQK